MNVNESSSASTEPDEETARVISAMQREIARKAERRFKLICIAIVVIPVVLVGLALLVFAIYWAWVMHYFDA